MKAACSGPANRFFMGRIREQLFYAGLACIFAAASAALIPLAIGRDLHNRARRRVQNARYRLLEASARIVKLIRG
jgi:hypothetical protein